MNKSQLIAFAIMSIVAVVTIALTVTSSLQPGNDTFEIPQEEQKRFEDLTCDEILEDLIPGLKFDTDDPTFSQERIWDCMKDEQGPSLLKGAKEPWCLDNNGIWIEPDTCKIHKDYDLYLEESGLVELNSLKIMDCKTFEKRNWFNNDYLTDENNRYVKEKLLDCHNQKEEFKILDAYSCVRLFELFDDEMDDILWAENMQVIREKMDQCVDDEQALSLTGNCKVMSERYYYGGDFIRNSHKDAMEQRLVSYCHYNLDER